MKYIKGKDRNQTTIFPISIEASIEQDNEVRFVDLFVESLDMGSMGFKTKFDENGRPAYHPKDLLKLYTISNFRRDNPKAIKKVFRITVSIAKNFDLIGGKLIAGDSTKFRAQNSKKITSIRKR